MAYLFAVEADRHSPCPLGESTLWVIRDIVDRLPSGFIGLSVVALVGFIVVATMIVVVVTTIALGIGLLATHLGKSNTLGGVGGRGVLRSPCVCEDMVHLCPGDGLGDVASCLVILL